MKQDQMLDLYSDYLLASFGATTATGLAQLMEGALSHDPVTLYLSGAEKTWSDLWRHVKPWVRQMQSLVGVLIIFRLSLTYPENRLQEAVERIEKALR